MEKEKFFRLIHLLEKQPTVVWIIPEYTDHLHQAITLLLEQIFNKEQVDWIYWWCYENDFGKKKLKASQTVNDIKIDVVDVHSLWNAINSLNE